MPCNREMTWTLGFGWLTSADEEQAGQLAGRCSLRPHSSDLRGRLQPTSGSLQAGWTCPAPVRAPN